MLIANLRKELSYMRTNLDNSKAACSQTEEAKMDLAYELKVVGNKRRRPLPPFCSPFFFLWPSFVHC